MICWFPTAEAFARIFPVGAIRQNRYRAALEAACQSWAITTPDRCAAFLAQVSHESCGLVFLEELGGPSAWSAYEGRSDLGNVRAGDGIKYHGRGPIQLTGRANYAEAGQALGLPLEAQPELVAEIEVGARVAARFWSTRGLNALADQPTQANFEAITRRINGGLRGLPDRLRRWQAVRAAMGLVPVHVEETP